METVLAPSLLPAEFVERLYALVPPGRVEAVLATFEAPRAPGFRINTIRVAPEAILDALRADGLTPEPVAGVPGAYTVPVDQRPGLLASLPYAQGHLYVQNVSSQLPALVLDPQPGERVLDLCAAPGSKTRQLACLMQNEGEVVAVEKVRERFYKLRSNLARQGSAVVLPVLASGAAYWHREPEAFDRVLVDAPCSTEGRFRVGDPETTRYWSPRKVREMQAKQRKLLFAGVQALRPGGTLVYSTCTFAPEENEVVLSKALRTFGGAVEVVEAGLPTTGPVVASVQDGLTDWNGQALDPQVAHARRVLPDGTLEAFFVARLRKHESTLR